MYSTAGNTIPERFTRMDSFTGNPTPEQQPCQNTFMREQAEQDILKAPGALDSKLSAVFANRVQECRSYVESKGEIPLNDPTRLAAQVCLLRAQDIANLGKALDVDDEESLRQIECTEQGVQDISSPDMYSALSFPTQAAIKIILDKLSDQCIKYGWSGSMADLIAILSGGSIGQGLSNGFADNTRTAAGLINHFDLSDIGIDDGSDGGSDISAVDLAPSDVNMSLAQVDPSAGSPISISPASLIPSISGTGSATASAPSQNGVLGFLSQVTSVAGQLSSAAQQTAGAINSTKSSIGNVLSGIGANSIQKYVQQNPLVAILAIALVIGIIVIAVHASKNSN